MAHVNTLDRARAALVIIDMQEAFRGPIADFAETMRRVVVVTRGARLLDVPILVTEQYPRGLGHTVEEIKTALPPAVTPLEKTAFSACGAAGFTNYLQQSSLQQIIVCGVETHVCVNQTVHDLLDRGYQVHVLADAVASRAPGDKQIALAKMRAGGALLSSTETALFELLRDASHAQFKAVQQLIK